MPSFNFKWDHPAEEVYVTGTFDNWAKTEKLSKQGTSFSKVVEFPHSEEKILYKADQQFVVDGQWTTDHTAPSERDHAGNINNVLTKEHIAAAAAGPTISSVAPGATTTGLAGAQPLTKTASSDLPGTFPETPNANEYSVNPIPATGGNSNPVQLAPGEKVPDPSTYTGNTVTSNVTLDKESYEKGATGAPVLPPVLNQQEQAEANGAGMFGVPPVGGTMIPESSLPMGGSKAAEEHAGPTISSVAPQSTTNQLAGQVPLEKDKDHNEGTDIAGGIAAGGAAIAGAAYLARDKIASAAGYGGASNGSANKTVPTEAEPASIAQKEGVSSEIKSKVPEAGTTSESGMLGKSENTSAGPPSNLKNDPTTAAPVDASQTAVGNKNQVQNELKETVPEAPTTSESGMLGKSEKSSGVTGAIAGGAAAAGAAVVGGAAAAKASADKAVPQSVQSTIDNMNKGQTSGVPEEVVESQKEAHVSPEASASPEAVKEKSAMEAELQKTVKPTNATGEPAPTASAALSETAPSKTTETGAATGGSAAATSGSAAATGGSAAALAPESKTGGTPKDSRDVSPMSRPAGESAPTTKDSAPPVPAKDSTPASTPQKNKTQAAGSAKATGTPQSTKTTDSKADSEAKKKNRRSFFGKIKDKLKN